MKLILYSYLRAMKSIFKSDDEEKLFTMKSTQGIFNTAVDLVDNEAPKIEK